MPENKKPVRPLDDETLQTIVGGATDEEQEACHSSSSSATERWQLR